MRTRPSYTYFITALRGDGTKMVGVELTKQRADDRAKAFRGSMKFVSVSVERRGVQS